MKNPRTYLIIGTLAAALNFWLVAKADAFWGFWQLNDLFSWMR